MYITFRMNEDGNVYVSSLVEWGHKISRILDRVVNYQTHPLVILSLSKPTRGKLKKNINLVLLNFSSVNTSW